ncbi:hypothetical protein [Streptomyces sp. CRN 30]|uniref:hypothetical protein n=1 Tax=Streptomyces sp. CRN 30 TaxID=3075613 RepID=UPI002A823D60|nr:hypothetical protein [Streptomyces sp. CRN 30]
MIKDLLFASSPLAEELRHEGRAQGRAAALLVVLEQRSLSVSDDIRKHISSCAHPATLDRWLRRAVTAPTAEDIFTDPTDE